MRSPGTSGVVVEEMVDDEADEDGRRLVPVPGTCSSSGIERPGFTPVKRVMRMRWLPFGCEG